MYGCNKQEGPITDQIEETRSKGQVREGWVLLLWRLGTGSGYIGVCSAWLHGYTWHTGVNGGHLFFW